MANYNYEKYYLMDSLETFFLSHELSLIRISKLMAIHARAEANLNRFKKIVISEELKKSFLQKLYELKGVV